MGMILGPAENLPRNPFSSPDSDTELDTTVQVERPKMYKVILLNDDFTPMDFVVYILKRFFGKTDMEATQIMLDVHKKGSGVAGVFTHEIAEMKVMQVHQQSEAQEHPLKCTMEEA
ncbi:MAG: ATP-dependent Clp protease adapter ClpS [Pseudobdellovibrionaceae bacterium]